MEEMDQNGDVLLNLSDTVFGFWEDFHAPPPENSSHLDHSLQKFNEEDQDRDQTLSSLQNNKVFWEQQYLHLLTTLYRTSSMETRVRQSTKEGLRELNMSDMQCICRRTMDVKNCLNCLRRELCDRLLKLGYNCALRTSKWTTSSKVHLSGEHTYLEVKDNSSTKREVKLVIELNFRAEFELARASEEYNRLVNQLPELYVGKVERLKAIIKIMCSAAEKCMEEKNMFIGPWRTQKYMQSKWLGMTNKRSKKTPLPMVYSRQTPKPRASMLTSDFY
ncbi:hypothetical protein Fmac_019274 [Flemingia macrophylla]|uniref:Uncharacterized protein n=1 Tax=Flemingia macrophylla TaxID=520843 RepID=A0ABD1M7C9_9FABA